MGVGLPPPETAGVPIGTGQKYDVLRRAGSSPVGRVKRIVSVSPLAVMPAMCARATGRERRGADDVGISWAF